MSKSIIDREKRWREAKEHAMMLAKDMNGLSEEGLRVKMLYDPMFRRGVDIITDLIVRSWEEDGKMSELRFIFNDNKPSNI